MTHIKAEVDGLRRRKIRRRLLAAGGRVGGIVIAVIFIVTSLTACGSGTGGAAGLKISSATPPATGDVKSVTWADSHGEPISLDPLKAYNYAENTVLGNACEALLSIAPDFTLQPRLASSYKRVLPTVWQYNIRKGVRFWDGAPLTAADVVYSIQRHLDPANASYYLEPFGQQIATVRATSPNTVQITTKRPSQIVNEMMATGLGTVGEAKYIQAKGSSYGTPRGGLMCTGPFEFGKWVPGQSITLNRNPNYWDKAMIPRIQQLEFRFIDDQSLLTNALLSGEIDGTYEVPASAVSQLRNSSAGHFYLGPALNNVALLPTLTGIRGPLKDIRVRQALSLAIDRQGVAQTAYSGAASPIRSTLILPIRYPFAPKQFSDAYKSLPSPTQNLDKAKALIQQAGAENGQPLTMAIPATDPASTQTANAVVSGAKQIGLRIQVKQVQPTDFDNFFFDPKARNKFDLALENNFADFADPLEFIAYAGLPGVQNFTNYENPKVTSLYYAAQNTGHDQQKRAALTIQAVKIFQDSLQIIPVLYTPERLFMGSGITGAPASFPYLYYPWAAKVGASGK